MDLKIQVCDNFKAIEVQTSAQRHEETDGTVQHGSFVVHGPVLPYPNGGAAIFFQDCWKDIIEEPTSFLQMIQLYFDAKNPQPLDVYIQSDMRGIEKDNGSLRTFIFNAITALGAFIDECVEAGTSIIDQVCTIDQIPDHIKPLFEDFDAGFVLPAIVVELKSVKTALLALIFKFIINNPQYYLSEGDMELFRQFALTSSIVGALDYTLLNLDDSHVEEYNNAILDVLFNALINTHPQTLMGQLRQITDSHVIDLFVNMFISEHFTEQYPEQMSWLIDVIGSIACLSITSSKYYETVPRILFSGCLMKSGHAGDVINVALKVAQQVLLGRMETNLNVFDAEIIRFHAVPQLLACAFGSFANYNPHVIARLARDLFATFNSFETAFGALKNAAASEMLSKVIDDGYNQIKETIGTGILYRKSTVGLIAFSTIAIMHDDYDIFKKCEFFRRCLESLHNTDFLVTIGIEAFAELSEMFIKAINSCDPEKCDRNIVNALIMSYANIVEMIGSEDSISPGLIANQFGSIVQLYELPAWLNLYNTYASIGSIIPKGLSFVPAYHANEAFPCDPSDESLMSYVNESCEVLMKSIISISNQELRQIDFSKIVPASYIDVNLAASYMQQSDNYADAICSSIGYGKQFEDIQDVDIIFTRRLLVPEFTEEQIDAKCAVIASEITPMEGENEDDWKARVYKIAKTQCEEELYTAFATSSGADDMRNVAGDADTASGRYVEACETFRSRIDGFDSNPLSADGLFADAQLLKCPDFNFNDIDSINTALEQAKESGFEEQLRDILDRLSNLTYESCEDVMALIHRGAPIDAIMEFLKLVESKELLA